METSHYSINPVDDEDRLKVDLVDPRGQTLEDSGAAHGVYDKQNVDETVSQLGKRLSRNLEAKREKSDGVTPSNPRPTHYAGDILTQDAPAVPYRKSPNELDDSHQRVETKTARADVKDTREVESLYDESIPADESELSQENRQLDGITPGGLNQEQPEREKATERSVSSTARRLFKVPTTLDWDKHRATITHLYIVEDKTLREVMRMMQRTYNFNAT